VNSGDSLSESRIQTEIPSRIADRRNGHLQPFSAKYSSPVHVLIPRMTSSERNRPSVAVVWIHEV